jgi:hypothetical protein
MEICEQSAQGISHERKVREAWQAAKAKEDEKVSEGVDGNEEGTEVDVIIGREVGDLEAKCKR